jgi:hypothetical protein
MKGGLLTPESGPALGRCFARNDTAPGMQFKSGHPLIAVSSMKSDEQPVSPLAKAAVKQVLHRMEGGGSVGTFGADLELRPMDCT